MIRTMSPVEQYTFIHNFSPKRNRKTIQKDFKKTSIEIQKKKIIKIILLNFSVRMLRYFLKKNKDFFAPESMKKYPQKLLIIGPPLFFQHCQPAQNLPKSHFLFHKNVSLRDFYIMTLIRTLTLFVSSF